MVKRPGEQHVLHSFVQMLKISQNDASTLLVRRWLPDMFGDVLWEHTRQFLSQKGLLEMVETCVPTRSETSTLDNSPHARPNKRETTDAGTQTDHPQVERKSILENASLVSMPRQKHLIQSTSGSDAGPQGCETSYTISQSTPA